MSRHRPAAVSSCSRAWGMAALLLALSSLVTLPAKVARAVGPAPPASASVAAPCPQPAIVPCPQPAEAPCAAPASPAGPAPALAPCPAAAAAPAVAGDEPDLAWLQRAALARARLEPERLDGLERRLRASALLPQVRVRVGRGTGQLQTLTDYDGTARLSVGDRDAWQFDVSASWSLDRLVYHPDELRLAREVERLAAHRERLLRQVAELYAERQRLRLALVHARARPGEAADMALRLAAVGATLDSLTVGTSSPPE